MNTYPWNTCIYNENLGALPSELWGFKETQHISAFNTFLALRLLKALVGGVVLRAPPPGCDFSASSPVETFPKTFLVCIASSCHWFSLLDVGVLLTDRDRGRKGAQGTKGSSSWKGPPGSEMRSREGRSTLTSFTHSGYFNFLKFGYPNHWD